MPPTCDELTFRLYVPITFQKNQVFRPQSRARLLKIFDFGTGDAIVRNDEVVGSIPTSSAFLNDLQARICGYVPPRSNSVHHSWLLTRSPSMAIVRRHCSLSRFRDALRVD